MVCCFTCTTITFWAGEIFNQLKSLDSLFLPDRCPSLSTISKRAKKEAEVVTRLHNVHGLYSHRYRPKGCVRFSQSPHGKGMQG
jgi:hypothetical protein